MIEKRLDHEWYQYVMSCSQLNVGKEIKRWLNENEYSKNIQKKISEVKQARFKMIFVDEVESDY